MTGQNAAVSQYGTPTPMPPIGTPTVGQPLPRTGADVGMEAVLGGVLLVAGVIVAVILKRWPA